MRAWLRKMMGYPAETSEEFQARLFDVAQAAHDRVYTQLRPHIDGSLRKDLELVLAGDALLNIEGWKIARFDTLKDLAQGDGYMLRSTDRWLQEPAHITARKQFLRDYADREFGDKPPDLK